MTRSSLVLPAVAFALCALALPAQAQTGAIYRCPDSSGIPIYTNSVNSREAQVRGCKLIERAPLPPAVSASTPVKHMPRSEPTPAQRASSGGASDGFPKVDGATQRQRDDSRRKILEEELSAEERNLTQAKKDLADQEGQRFGDERNYQRVLDRLKPFQDKVGQHERNIQAVRKELANLR